MMAAMGFVTTLILTRIIIKMGKVNATKKTDFKTDIDDLFKKAKKEITKKSEPVKKQDKTEVKKKVKK